MPLKADMNNGIWDADDPSTPKSIDWSKKIDILGEVGVDSASVTISDGVERKQVEVYTPNGDGRYAVYGRMIDGRRCLVVDFDAIYDHNICKLRRLPLDEWRCPDCGKEEHSGGQSSDTTFFNCENGHSHEVYNPIIE